jgi:glutathione S-transferase
VIELWELGGKAGRRYSLFSWRTRMALAYKGLRFETRPVCMSDKAAIAFSGGKTVPVIRDVDGKGNDFVVRDSWKIAEYLETRYPETPSLFGGDIGRGLAQTFCVWVDRDIVPAMLPVIVADIHERVEPADEEYVRRQFEGLLKKTLEQLRDGREESLKRLGRALEPMQSALKRQPWVCGENPAYADFALFSVFQWARVMSPWEVLGPESPLCSWRERCLDLYDGFARNVPVA